MTNLNHTQESADAAREAIVEQLLRFGGSMALVIDHMARFRADAGSAPDAPPFDVVLHGLLSDVLRPVIESHIPEDVGATAVLLTEITETVGHELVLVPFGEAEELSEGP
jgi:hypothetical protein